MKEAILKSTILPYFLYYMRDDRAKLVKEDDGGISIYYDRQKVDYEKMSKVFIFLLKHLLPLWCVYSFFDISIYRAIDNWFVPFTLMALVLPSFYLFRFKSHFLIFYFASMFVLFYNIGTYHTDLIFDVNYSFNIVTYVIFIVYLTLDMYLTYTKFEYYYLKDVKTSIEYTKGRPHLTLGFWKLKKTFYFSKKVPKTFGVKLIGTFVKVPNDEEIEWSDVK